MSKRKGFFDKHLRVFLLLIIFIAVVYLIGRDVGAFGNVLLVLLGFGAVVLVHEFGHFVTAKAAGIKVEAFSIFMPPILLGLQRTEDGLRIRILPEIFPNEDDPSGDGALIFTVGGKGKASETEYRIGLIPFGGFVKMLGQDDVGPDKSSDDPRSFANKPAHTRAAVLASGVVFNVISAVIIFMIVFLIGIHLPPAVVGGVAPGSPAERAGLKAGDEIIKIADKDKDLDYSNIAIAAALSGRDEKVAIRVRHEDGSEEDLELVAEQVPGEPMRTFGVSPPKTLTIAELAEDDPNELFERTGLRPGDRITAVNGMEVQSHWELEEMVKNTLAPEVTLSAERMDKDKGLELVESKKIGLELTSPRNGHVYSMVPRFRMENLRVTRSAGMKIAAKMRGLLERIGIKARSKKRPFLQSGDVILSVGEVAYPTDEEFRDTVKKHGNKELSIKVLRVDPNGTEREHTINVRPKPGADANEARIGIVFYSMFDFDHPVVAKTITIEDGPEALKIPPGAVITAVDGTPVSNFYDIIRQIKRYPGERVTIDYRLNEEVAGSVALDVSSGENSVAVGSTFAELIPFKRLERPYKANGPLDAVAMGYRRTVMFVAQTYVTLKRLVGGLVSPKNLMGPVGIITFSYHIVAEQPKVYYVYFLGLISAVIAVFNFLPLPPLDGGLVVLLLAEKIKGSALSERIQTIVAYAGWTIIGTLILYVTFNDIVRSFVS